MRGQNKLKLLFVSITILTLIACASQKYLYLPTGVTHQDSERAQKGKAYYPIPPEKPTGNAQVMSNGIVKLKPDEGGTTIPALHIKMVLSNQSDTTPWSVTPQNQKVTFPNMGGQVTPTFVQSSPPATPNLILNQGEMRTLNLYFSLPDQEKSADEIPEFDFRWQVKIGERIIEESTSFDRVLIPSYSSNYYNYPYSQFGPYSSFGYPLDFGWTTPLIVVPPPVMGPPPSKPVIIGH